MLKKSLFILFAYLFIFIFNSSAFAEMKDNNFLMAVLFNTQNMRDKAIMEIKRIDMEISKNAESIQRSEKIISLAQQQGNTKAEMVARDALMIAQDAKRKNEESKSKAEANKALAEANQRSNCEKTRETRQRLAAGLPVMIEAIKKTDALIKTAKNDINAAKANMVFTSIDAVRQEALDFTKEFLSTAEALRVQVRFLKGLNKGISDATRKKVLDSLQTVALSADKIIKTYKEGSKTGNNLQKDIRTATGYLVEANRLFVESGIASECGEELSEKMMGPLGKYAFRGANLSIDLGVAYGQKKISESEYLTEENSLNIMLSQCKLIETKILEIDKNLEQYCK